ncbi:MAG: hypothetical protein SPL45_01005 [Schwartzia succinivorans]|nr:hypothetical protein [Schwartzia succinivorans]
MKINDIKAALSTRMSSLHVEPISMATPKPVEEKAAAKPEPTDIPPRRRKTKKVDPKVIQNYIESLSERVTLQHKVVAESKTQSENGIVQSKPLSSPLENEPKRSCSSTQKEAANKNIEAIIAENLKAGSDYAIIPGCGRKPALLKSGAEKLAQYFGYTSTCEVINRTEDYAAKFVLYEVQTTLRDSRGVIIAQGIGSCNTFETKYQRQSLGNALNTIEKMAKKRSYVDAVLTATGSSFVFTQDVEDIENFSNTAKLIRKEA